MCPLSFGLFCSDAGALIRAGAPGLALRFKIRMCSDFAGPDRHRPCTNLELLALKTARVFVVVDFPIVLFTRFSGEFYISSTHTTMRRIFPGILPGSPLAYIPALAASLILINPHPALAATRSKWQKVGNVVDAFDGLE